MYIITYISYREFKDREVYTDQATAYRRYETLVNCPNASHVKIEKKDLH